MIKSDISVDDAALVKALIFGDERAFSALYKRYYHRLLFIAKAITKSQEISEGIVQEVFLKIWERRKVLKVSGSFHSFAYTMVKNLSLNYIRDNVTRAGFRQDLFRKMCDAFHHTENEVWLNLMQEHLDDILKRLSERRRSVYELSRQEGLSHDEIAQRLGITKQSVKNHITKAMQIIRLEMQEIVGTSYWLKTE